MTSKSTPRPDGTPGWVIGRAAGAPVILARSWLVAAVVLTVLVAPAARTWAPLAGDVATYLVAFSFVVLLFVSVFLHELAHGYMARARGLEVREFAITLWGGHTAFGAAASSPGSSALIAVVGPAANLVVGAVCWLAIQAVPGGVLGGVLYAGAFANAFVAVFNLVPGLPLDGGRVLEALVWKVSGDRLRGTVVAGWAGRLVAVGFAVWAIGLPLLRGSRLDILTILWPVLIGTFLWSGAGGAIRGAQAQRALDRLTVDAVARPAVGVPLTSTLAQAQRAAEAAGASAVVLLAPDGRPVGYIDPDAAATVPDAARPTTAVQAVAVPLADGAVVDGRLVGPGLVHAIGQVARSAAVMAVLVDGQVTGLVFVPDVAAALRPRS